VVNDGVITGWNKVSEWLGVSVRTAQTYHNEHAMPVRKFPGKRIYIVIEEVKKWLLAQEEKKP